LHVQQVTVLATWPKAGNDAANCIKGVNFMQHCEVVAKLI